jgi:hypothetical protein
VIGRRLNLCPRLWLWLIDFVKQASEALLREVSHKHLAFIHKRSPVGKDAEVPRGLNGSEFKKTCWI